MRTILAYLWSESRIGLVVVVGVAVVAGLLSAWFTPRGVITTTQALVSIAVALITGIVAGLATGKHWSTLLTPIAYVLVFELARLGLEGPTIGRIHMDSTYGIIAFILGRLVHGVIVLTPMMLGTVYGVWLTAYLGKDVAATPGLIGGIVTGLATLALIAMTGYIARPASTHPIVGSDGSPLPGSIAELISVPIGGHNQAMMIRGRSAKAPVLLYLAGGPGGTDLGAMRADTGLEQTFVVVTWEQRGAGKSYASLDPVETLTLEQAVNDTIAVTNYLRERFDEEKIYLMGNSWGTTLGILAAQQHPELFYAFVGTGQMVSQRETDIMFYEDTLAWAKRTGNDALVATLRHNGPPPYDNLFDYESALAHERDWNIYPRVGGYTEMPGNLFVPENTLMDQINGMRAFLDTFSILYPQLQHIDFRQDVTHLDIPVYMVIGKYEARGRAVLANEWFELLNAPVKERIVFEDSGHRPSFEEPAAFVAVMNKVLNATYVSK